MPRQHRQEPELSNESRFAPLNQQAEVPELPKPKSPKRPGNSMFGGYPVYTSSEFQPDESNRNNPHENPWRESNLVWESMLPPREEQQPPPLMPEATRNAQPPVGSNVFVQVEPPSAQSELFNLPKDDGNEHDLRDNRREHRKKTHKGHGTSDRREEAHDRGDRRGHSVKKHDEATARPKNQYPKSHEATQRPHSSRRHHKTPSGRVTGDHHSSRRHHRSKSRERSKHHQSDTKKKPKKDSIYWSIFGWIAGIRYHKPKGGHANKTGEGSSDKHHRHRHRHGDDDRSRRHRRHRHSQSERKEDDRTAKGTRSSRHRDGSPRGRSDRQHRQHEVGGQGRHSEHQGCEERPASIHRHDFRLPGPAPPGPYEGLSEKQRGKLPCDPRLSASYGQRHSDNAAPHKDTENWYSWGEGPLEEASQNGLLHPPQPSPILLSTDPSLVDSKDSHKPSSSPYTPSPQGERHDPMYRQSQPSQGYHEPRQESQRWSARSRKPARADHQQKMQEAKAPGTDFQPQQGREGGRCWEMPASEWESASVHTLSDEDCSRSENESLQDRGGASREQIVKQSTDHYGRYSLSRYSSADTEKNPCTAVGAPRSRDSRQVVAYRNSAQMPSNHQGDEEPGSPRGPAPSRIERSLVGVRPVSSVYVPVGLDPKYPEVPFENISDDPVFPGESISASRTFRGPIWATRNSTERDRKSVVSRNAPRASRSKENRAPPPAGGRSNGQTRPASLAATSWLHVPEGEREAVPAPLRLPPKAKSRGRDRM